MDFLQPTNLEEALAIRAERSDAEPICGGTDLMVDINFDRARPAATMDLTRLVELQQIERETGADALWIGSGVPFLRIMDELAAECPGLCMAARTVGSPQIRARGTLGGNLGTASPAGDSLPMLAALGAQVEARSTARGSRLIDVSEFIVRPRMSALEVDELITRVRVPLVRRGGEQFAKVGQRNAMVISIASFGLVIDADARRVGTGIGSAGPRILVASDAERELAAALEQNDAWSDPSPLADDVVTRFGELVSAAASPIDDVRGSARYRRHALDVVAQRTLRWAWNDYRSAVTTCA